MSSHQLRPRLEGLEDRTVPATFGIPWPDATHLTLSFAPDGTNVADRSSDLFQSLDSQMPRHVWQSEILRAVQTWAEVANVNVGVVADGGLPFGTPGATQGDERFGDLRIAAYPMGPQVYGVASPFEATAGTWTGDIKLNTSYRFGDGTNGTVDLYSVVLHEIGHALGLDHRDDPSSPMFAKYGGVRHGLTDGDIAALQALYGPRQPDTYEGSGGNESFRSATAMRLLSSLDGTTRQTLDAELTTAGDRDIYKFTTPLNAGAAVVQLRTSGASLLNAKLSVYDSNLRLVGSAVASDPANGDLTVRVSRLNILSTYYIKVESAQAGDFDVGSYRLQVTQIPLLHSLLHTLTPIVEDVRDALIEADPHTNDSFLTATSLTQSLYATPSHYNYMFRGVISDSWDDDFYKIKAPDNGSSVMTVMAWRLKSGGLDPDVQIYNAWRQPVATEVLVHESGQVTLQVRNVAPGATYYVKVFSEASRPNHVGSYFLGVDFSQHALALETLASGALRSDAREDLYTFTVSRSSLYHFALSAHASFESAVRLTVYYSQNRAITSIVANAGDTTTGRVILEAGTYTLRIAGAAKSTSSFSSLNYVLRGALLDDPVGPKPNDSTTSPSGSDSSTTTTTTTKQSGSKTYTDPYNDPYATV